MTMVHADDLQSLTALVEPALSSERHASHERTGDDIDADAQRLINRGRHPMNERQRRRKEKRAKRLHGNAGSTTGEIRQTEQKIESALMLIECCRSAADPDFVARSVASSNLIIEREREKIARIERDRDQGPVLIAEAMTRIKALRGQLATLRQRSKLDLLAETRKAMNTLEAQIAAITRPAQPVISVVPVVQTIEVLDGPIEPAVATAANAVAAIKKGVPDVGNTPQGP